MAQGVQALASRTDDLNSILQTHLREEENHLPQVVLNQTKPNKINIDESNQKL